jgi:hypothetical protein
MMALVQLVSQLALQAGQLVEQVQVLAWTVCSGHNLVHTPPQQVCWLSQHRS